LQADQAQSMAIKMVEQARKQQEKSSIELF
jgi:hypothetical protein